jgi:HlyD family secretion protein
MKKKPVLLVGAAIVVVVAIVGAVAMRGRSGKALEVQTDKVTRQRIVQKVSSTGKIRPRTQVEISADVSAKIIQLPVVEGQAVKKGDLLVGLDRERYVAAVESAEASVGSAEANATLVHKNMILVGRSRWPA